MISEVSKAILTKLFIHKKIGEAHAVEKNVFGSKLKYVTKQQKKKFEKEYKQLINKRIILRRKKKTGKGMGWHISLNPKKLKEVTELLK